LYHVYAAYNASNESNSIVEEKRREERKEVKTKPKKKKIGEEAEGHIIAYILDKSPVILTARLAKGLGYQRSEKKKKWRAEEKRIKYK
jgi:hypothetical protein